MLKKLVASLLVAMLLVATLASVAMAATGSYGRWNISPSNSRASNKVKKDDKQEAVVSASVHTPSITAWYGLRGSKGVKKVHKSAVSKTRPSAFSIAYKSGKGIPGNEYTISVQNDSNNKVNVTVAGTWEP